MRTMKYNLMTLNPKEMLNHYDVIKTESGNYAISYCYDFSASSFMDNLIISSIDSFDENALLYQLEKVVRKPNDDTWGEDSLQHHILYIDFSEVFKNIHFDVKEKQSFKREELSIKSATVDTKLSFLFDPENGIHITFKSNDRNSFCKKTFVPFDKSSSMARNCRITFIDKEIKEELDKRLKLDYDFSSINVILSKYYAYRGLYLTSAHRVETDDNLILNEETVIVINDDQNFVTTHDNNKKQVNHKMFKEIGKIEEGGIFWKLGEKEESVVRINPFDGEGLISPEYAHLINKKLGKYGYRNKRAGTGDFTTEASTYQIRMPFTKGVLHTVDFNGFIDEYVTQNKTVMIRDMFGIQRNIRKAEIILTESMFKCCKWIKKLWMNEHHDFSSKNDIMKDYFDKMSKYDHSLYVGNTDITLSDDCIIKMNYQFLNTLDMPAEDFEKLIIKHNLQARNVNELFLVDADDMSEDTVSEGNTASVWKRALSRNKALLNDPKIKGMINGTEETLMIDCAGGKIRVAGECRFLSCDLLALLLYIVKKLRIEKSLKQKSSEIQALYSDKFYMPDSRITLSPDKYYGILRNPHLSRNEQVVLMPYIAKRGSVYDKYFSHLSGVIMLSRNSLVPNTLSGADFDGDLVKIVSEESIVSAIKRGAYSEAKEGNKVVRKLPIIEIPNTKEMAKPTKDKGTIPYNVIKNTFSNSIGQISNLAIQIGKKEYLENDPIFANKCAECTVVTGLEIDAAKTGVHPKRNIEMIKNVLKFNGSEAKDKDYYLNINETLSMLGRDKFSVRIERSGKQFKLKKARGKKALLSIIPYELTDRVANIDRLPYYYALEKLQKEEKKNQSKGKNSKRSTELLYFKFQVEDIEWKKKLNSELKDETKKLIAAYLAVMKLARRIYKYKKKFTETKFSRCVLTILRLQYDSLDSVLCCKVPIGMALDSVYAYFDEILKSTADAQNALKNLIDLKWQYAAKDERDILLEKILSASEDNPIPVEIRELLCNFDNGGYNLLYYIFQHIISDKLKNFTPELYEERQKIKGKIEEDNTINNIYYKVLYRVFYESANKGESKKVWEKKIVSYCRLWLNELFADDMDYALKYVFVNRGTDKTSKFLWDVIPEKTIMKNIYDNPWKGE